MNLREMFGKKLKQIREAKGLTQQKLAELCNMETTSIGMIEIGKRGVSFDKLSLLSEHLDVDFDELFNFKQDFSLEKSDNELLSKLGKIARSFNGKQLEHLIENAQSIKKH